MLESPERDLQAVLLDLDGTVAQSIALGLGAHNAFAEFTARPYVPITVHPIDVPRLESYRNLGYRKALRELDINLAELLLIRRRTNAHMRRIARDVPAFEGMPQLVRSLCEVPDLQTGVVSSGVEEYVEAFLETHEITGLDIVQGGAGLLLKSRAINRALRKIGVNPRNAMYIGDEPRDTRAANKLNMISVGVTWGVAGKEGFVHEQPHHLVETVPELESVIHGYLSRR